MLFLLFRFYCWPSLLESNCFSVACAYVCMCVNMSVFEHGMLLGAVCRNVILVECLASTFENFIRNFLLLFSSFVCYFLYVVPWSGLLCAKSVVMAPIHMYVPEYTRMVQKDVSSHPPKLKNIKNWDTRIFLILKSVII